MQTSLLRSICNSEQLWILSTFGCPDLVEMQHLSSPTMSYRALGKLEKNISYIHSRESWASHMSGSDLCHRPLLFSHCSHTLLHLFMKVWHSSPQESALPASVLCPLCCHCPVSPEHSWEVACYPEALALSYFMWKTFYPDTVSFCQQPEEMGLIDSLPGNTCSHPPQNNHWLQSTAIVCMLWLPCPVHQQLPDSDSGLCWLGIPPTMESNPGQDEPVHRWRIYLAFCLWNRVPVSLCMGEKESKDEWYLALPIYS